MRLAEGGELDKGRGRISRMFDNISPTYDNLNHLLSLGNDAGWRGRTLEELDLEKGDLVLDIATGTGDLAIAARRASDCRVIGLDLSRGMLSEALNKWDKEFGDHYQMVQGDAQRMPFADDVVDKMMVAFGIRNMSDIDAFLSEAARVLREDGRIAVLELSIPMSPLLRPIYLSYLIHVLPAIGGWCSGSGAAYKYLGDSIRDLPAPGELVVTFESHGLKVLRTIPLTRGICHLYILAKDDGHKVRTTGPCAPYVSDAAASRSSAWGGSHPNVRIFK